MEEKSVEKNNKLRKVLINIGAIFISMILGGMISIIVILWNDGYFTFMIDIYSRFQHPYSRRKFISDIPSYILFGMSDVLSDSLTWIIPGMLLSGILAFIIISKSGGSKKEITLGMLLGPIITLIFWIVIFFLASLYPG